MHSFLAVIAFTLFGQVAADGRYENFQPEGATAGLEADAGGQLGSGGQLEAGGQAEPWDVSPVTPREQTPDPGKSVMPRAADALQRREGAVEKPVNRVEVAASTNVVKPVDLFEMLSRPPVSGRLGGELVTLTEAVATASSRAEQTAIVEAYWKLSTALIDYYLSVREATELSTSLQGITTPGADWQEARRAQASQLQVKRRTAELAQYELHRLMKSSAIDGLPLTVDLPHAGAYETRYKENFGDRQSSRAERLHELIPAAYENLKLQALQIASDERWLQLVSRQRSPQSDGTGLLKTHELLSLRRREFVQAVRDYNLQIARYSELATPGRVGTQRLVAMLIENPSLSAPGGERSGVATTSGEEPVQRESAPRGGNRTFAPQERDVRREPAAEIEGQRSILVRPTKRVR